MIQAIIGGATVALIIWLTKIPGDVRSHDRLIRERDEDLSTWLADEKLSVDRELATLLDELAARNLVFSGARLSGGVRIKEAALQRWRDQERSAHRARAELEGHEEWPHRVWRFLLKRRLPILTAPTRGKPILDHWRAPESYEDSPEAPVSDPTTRTVETAVRELG